MAPIIIVGSGLAGYSLAREFRKLNQEMPVLIITADDGRAYSKPMLSNALTKGKAAGALVNADAEKMASQLKVEIRTQTRISKIHTEAHEVVIGDETISYSKLVLVLGADPFRPPLQGEASAVLSVNDLNDYERFRLAIEGKKSVAILGGGLIGCEFANDLAHVGIHVTTIDRNSFPLGRLLPEAVGRKLLTSLEKIGVNWYGNDTVSRVEKEGDGFYLELEKRESIIVDVVLSAIGLSPRIALAQESGLKTHRGIVTDRYLQTTATDVYALGDCAEVDGLNLPFIMPLMRSAKALAATLAGTPTPVSYPAMPVALKTPAYSVSVCPPPAGIEGEWEIKEKGESIHALFYDREDALRGFALGGEATKNSSTLASKIPSLIL